MQLDDFDVYKFNSYLREKNIFCCIKMHPIDEDFYKNSIQEYSNILFINRFDLQNKDIELDNILAAFDLLITDYSSIYIDYLLVNKPIVFLKQNYKEYKHSIVMENENEIAGLITYKQFVAKYTKLCDPNFKKKDSYTTKARFNKHYKKFIQPLNKFAKWIGECFSVVYYSS